MRTIKWAIELRPGNYAKMNDQVILFNTRKDAKLFGIGKVVKVEILMRTL